MPIPVSPSFAAAEQSDANLPVSRVQLVLGNYASAPAYGTVAAASSTFSADFPASGAIDGDRTEINVGPASGADDGVGRSSWQSSVAPDTTPQTLTLTFSQSRDVNRVKLYHRNGHGLRTYYLQWWDGMAWNTFAATSDIVVPGQVSIVTTHQLDTVDFPDITTTMIRLIVNHTQVAAENAQVVELEAYRLLDVTDRVIGLDVSRGRDYKLFNPMASTLQLTCTNVDRFFSPNHIPTTAEVSQGFINSELRPELGVIVSLGWNYFNEGAPELISTFVGTLDRLTLRPKARDAVIEFRDGMKRLINFIDSSRLKSGQDIAENIRYTLNRANISNYEMALDETGIIIDYFFTDAQDMLTTVRDLTQAAVDAAFYFDEAGIATFQFYAGNVTVDHVYTSEADWEAGTLQDINTTEIPGNLIPDYTGVNSRQATGFGQSLSGWIDDGTGAWSDNGGTNVEAVPGTPPEFGINSLYRALNTSNGRWELTIHAVHMAADSNAFFFVFQAQNISDPGTTGGIVYPYAGYAIETPTPTSIAIVRVNDPIYRDPGSITTLASFGIADIQGADHVIRATKDPTGLITLWLDGVMLGSVTDTTYPTGRYMGLAPRLPSGGTDFKFGDGILYTPAVNLTGIWTSPPLDTGVNTVAFDFLMSTTVLNGGTISYRTRSSPDAVVWDPYIAVPPSGQILSAPHRFLQTQAFLSTGSTMAGFPNVLDITVSWTVGSSRPKFPVTSSFTFSFDATLLDVQQEIADNLGGDSSILNDVTVQAKPLFLDGMDTDTQWQGTVGTPPVAISGSSPLSVAVQTYTFPVLISGGMDVSRMSGANPAAAVVVFGAGAAGSWSFSSIHPTLPVLVIVVTSPGTITDLRIIGKAFADAKSIQAQVSMDAASIALYGDRSTSISNVWIVGATVAADIAAAIVKNFKSPTAYIPQTQVRPCWNCQIGDRVTISDLNLDLTADYIITSAKHAYRAEKSSGQADTQMVLLKIPMGA